MDVNDFKKFYCQLLTTAVFVKFLARWMNGESLESMLKELKDIENELLSSNDSNKHE